MIRSLFPVLAILLLQASAPIERSADLNVCLSAEEKKLYDLIMSYRKDNKLESISIIDGAY